VADDIEPPRSRLKQVRLLLWLLVALSIAGLASLLLLRKDSPEIPQASVTTTQASFGGPFTLVGADAKPFSSAKLSGKPYVIFFGFTRCGDVCPTTLSRLVNLRRAATTDDKLNIVFVTIDPENDGPKEVGQYAELFNAPIIGLTGTQAQIDLVKKQYGIHAEPTPHGAMGEQFEHTASVLLFDRNGGFAGTLPHDEPQESAVAKLKKLVA
jgi:protein SCO1/2